MKAMTDYMTPGKEQAMLAKSAGDWSANINMWMDPSQPPMTMQAKVRNEMKYGGRYLETRYSGMMMGMPYEGLGTIGYDNAAKKYMTTWIDNMGTGIMYMEGTMNADKRSVEFKGTGVDPMTSKPIKMREVITFKDDNNQKMEMYMMQDGKEMKTMEITLTKM